MNPGTGVDIRIDGEPIWSSGGYSISEDGSAIDPSDMSGGFGQINVTVSDAPSRKRLGGKVLEFSDGAQGETQGVIRGLSGDGLSATIVADGRLGYTAVIRQAQPFTGTLGDALRYYLSLCGVEGSIFVAVELESIPVRLPGWKANVFDQLKRLGHAHGFETALVSSNIVFRLPRDRVAANYRNASIGWALDEGNLAQSVEGYFYNTTTGTGLAYPPGGWNDDVTVYTVEAGETIEVDLEIEASLSSVQQPTCLEFVGRDHASSSVYTVSGNDGLPIPPAQWAEGGGSVTVRIGEDTRSLIVTMRGSSDATYAPYRIAVSSGPSDYYSSLRLVGTGVFFEKELFRMESGLDEDRAPTEIGATVDNEFFESKDQLYHALLWTLARYSTPRQTINVQSKGINRVGESGSYAYPTIGDLAALHPGATIASIASEPGLGGTIDEWNATLFATVADDFANQAFGNLGGARVRHDDCWYRIRPATLTQTSINYTAEWDNTIGDVYRTGETIAEWNARLSGSTIADVNVAPLVPL